MMYELAGTDPENLRVFRDFWLLRGFAAVAALKRRGGCKRGDFQGGADTTGEIRFTSVRLQRKQKRCILFTFGMSCPSGPSKTSLASAARPERYLSH